MPSGPISRGINDCVRLHVLDTRQPKKHSGEFVFRRPALGHDLLGISLALSESWTRTRRKLSEGRWPVSRRPRSSRSLIKRRSFFFCKSARASVSIRRDDHFRKDLADSFRKRLVDRAMQTMIPPKGACLSSRMLSPSLTKIDIETDTARIGVFLDCRPWAAKIPRSSRAALMSKKCC